MLDTDVFERLLVGLQGKIDAETFETFAHFYRHGEYGLAVEVLCEQLVESEQVLPSKEAGMLRDLGESMGIEDAAFDVATTGI